MRENAVTFSIARHAAWAPGVTAPAQWAAWRASSNYLRRVGASSGLHGVLRHVAAFAKTILDKMLLWGGLFDHRRIGLSGAEPLLEWFNFYDFWHLPDSDNTHAAH